MNRYILKDLQGVEVAASVEVLPDWEGKALKNGMIAGLKSERTVEVDSEPYTEDDILESIPAVTELRELIVNEVEESDELLETIPAVIENEEEIEPEKFRVNRLVELEKSKVRLRAQYIIEIEDISAEVQAQAIRQAVANAINKGQQLIAEFATENVMLGITQDNMTAQVLDNMGPVMTAMQSGSLYLAIDRIRAIPLESKDSKYITDVRLLQYVNRLEAYLGLPLSEQL